MAKKQSKLEQVQQDVEKAVKRTNKKIKQMGKHTGNLFTSLNNIQTCFNCIRNVPEEEKLKYEKLKKVRLNWKQQVDDIEMQYKKSTMTVAGQGATGVGASVAVAALGPSVAMGVATTFGVASTGTAISSLSGVAATNAALAWLGGGTLATGGGGMVAGSAFLALAGPLGWTIAGLATLITGAMFFKANHDKERLENIYILIGKRDLKSYELAMVELEERIKRIQSEHINLEQAITKIETFGTDYLQMTESQQYELGAYVNLMEASTALLTNPILGLKPKYTEEHFEALCSSASPSKIKQLTNRKSMIIGMSNLLYKIDLDEDDKRLLVQSLQKNKEFLRSINISEKTFEADALRFTERALKHRYRLSTY